MKNKGFASIYIIYSFFLIFMITLATVLMVNNYQKKFLNILKNEIKEELQTKNIPTKP